jgi:hypothetical protein
LLYSCGPARAGPKLFGSASFESKTVCPELLRVLRAPTFRTFVFGGVGNPSIPLNTERVPKCPPSSSRIQKSRTDMCRILLVLCRTCADPISGPTLQGLLSISGWGGGFMSLTRLCLTWLGPSVVRPETFLTFGRALRTASQAMSFAKKVSMLSFPSCEIQDLELLRGRKPSGSLVVR